MKNIIAIVPARGNSKGLKRKNMYPLLNKPLLAWTLDAAKQTEIFKDIIVSSEDEDILNFSVDYGVTAFKRNNNLSQDNTLTTAVITDILLNKYDSDNLPEIFILLQVTSPLRAASHINEAYDLFLNSGATALISGTIPKLHPLKSMILNKDGYLKNLYPGHSPFVPRQTLPKAFYQNGAIYINYVDIFLKTKTLFTDKTIPYYMDEKVSIDIDTVDDIYAASVFLQSKE